MIDIFSKYGEVLRTGIKSPREYLEFLAKKAPLNKDRSILLKLDFSLTDRAIDVIPLEITKENNENEMKRYLWVGNTPDTTNRYLSSNNVTRFIFGKENEEKNPNPIKQLAERLQESPLKQHLNEVLNEFFPDSLQGYADLKKLRMYRIYIQTLFALILKFQNAVTKKDKNESFREIQEFCDYTSKEELSKWAETVKTQDDLEQTLQNEFDLIITDQFKDDSFFKQEKRKKRAINNYFNAFAQISGIQKNSVVLCTIAINHTLVADYDDYVSFLYNEKMPAPLIKNVGSSSNKPSGKRTKKMSGTISAYSSTSLICSVCGQQRDDVCADYLVKAQVKFFNTDKAIFSTQLAKDFTLNFALCNSCFEKLLLGEKYILTQFRKRWLTRSLLLIPEISPMETITYDNLMKVAENSNQVNNLMYNFEENRNFEKSIEDLVVYLGGNMLVYHYVFFTQTSGGKPNKVIKIIKDVPPSRLLEILRTISNIKNQDLIQSSTPIDLRHLYYLIPIRLDKKKVAKSTDIIFTLFESILLKNLIDRAIIVESFTDTICALMLESDGLNITNPQPKYKMLNLRNKILQMNTTLQFLEQIQSINLIPHSIEVEEPMIERKTPNSLWDAVKKYWVDKTIYNLNQTRALFLYGMMIADVGSAQYKSLKSEPILKKINFDGMNRDRIIQLVNEIIDKLQKYKDAKKTSIYTYNKEIHAVAQDYFEKVNPENWELTPSENVFYIMSGYTFKREYLRKTHAEEESNETVDENIIEEQSDEETEEEELE